MSATLADILRGAADRIDAEDVPQTADDVADFVDGARWATAQLRRIAGEADAGPAGDATPDWLADLARRYATGLNSAERATLRFALELAEDQMLSRGNEFAAVDFAALESLKQRAGGGAAEPGYTESVDYQVVGDWGVDGADSAEGARAAVAKWLRAYPKCGARAEQRIVRDWEDGSEFYGPWTPLAGD